MRFHPLFRLYCVTAQKEKLFKWAWPKGMSPLTRSLEIRGREVRDSCRVSSADLKWGIGGSLWCVEEVACRSWRKSSSRASENHSHSEWNSAHNFNRLGLVPGNLQIRTPCMGDPEKQTQATCTETSDLQKSNTTCAILFYFHFIWRT